VAQAAVHGTQGLVPTCKAASQSTFSGDGVHRYVAQPSLGLLLLIHMHSLFNNLSVLK